MQVAELVRWAALKSISKLLVPAVDAQTRPGSKHITAFRDLYLQSAHLLKIIWFANANLFELVSGNTATINSFLTPLCAGIQ